MFNLKKIGMLFLLLGCLLSTSASAFKLRHPIPNGSRIGVMAHFYDRALFQRVGLTDLDNASFYRRIPSLPINAFLTTIAANDLYRSRRFKVVPIYQKTEKRLLNTPVTRRGRLTPTYQAYLAPFVREKKLKTLLLIVPNKLHFGNGQYVGSIWKVHGYGLFSRAFPFMETNTIFAAYRVYVIDAHNYRVLARVSGHLKLRALDIQVAWKEGYAGLTPNDLSFINKILREQLPSALLNTVHQTGLP